VDYTGQQIGLVQGMDRNRGWGWTEIGGNSSGRWRVSGSARRQFNLAASSSMASSRVAGGSNLL
jgi:hypothetical protein